MHNFPKILKTTAFLVPNSRKKGQDFKPFLSYFQQKLEENKFRGLIISDFPNSPIQVDKSEILKFSYSD